MRRVYRAGAATDTIESGAGNRMEATLLGPRWRPLGCSCVRNLTGVSLHDREAQIAFPVPPVPTAMRFPKEQSNPTRAGDKV